MDGRKYSKETSVADLKVTNNWQDVAEMSGLTGGGDLFIQPKGDRCVVQFGATAPPADAPTEKSIEGTRGRADSRNRHDDLMVICLSSWRLSWNNNYRVSDFGGEDIL